MALRYVLLLVISIMLPACSPVGTANSITDNSLLSLCSHDLRANYLVSYYAMVRKPGACMNCHTEAGPSPYHFASPDGFNAFAQFMRLGADRVDARALDPTHAQGVTGPHMQASIDAARATWNPAYSVFKLCQEPPRPTSVDMIPKNDPDLYFGDGRTVTFYWSMDTEEISPASGRFPGVFAMDIKINYQDVAGVKTAVGYTFTRPRLEMFTGEFQVEIEGVVVKINGVKAEGMEQFLSARKTARGADPTVLFDGSVAVNLDSVSTSDKISVSLGYLSIQARTDNPPTPPTPVLTVARPFIATANLNVTSSNDGTARRWCLTADSRTPSSTSAPCPGFENSLTGNGWLSARPGAFSLTNLGRTINPGETVPLYLWVANSDLRISAAPGTASVTFDPTAPDKVSFSLSLGSTQVADIVSLTDSNEPVEWCVLDGATSMSVEQSNGCSFSPYKPLFAPLRGGGIRYVSVFVRDRAQNITRSDTATVNNTYGRITYVQLADAALGARGVIANKCFSCHGAGGANQANWDATSYTNTAAKKSAILNRISSSTAPMPPTGLLPDKERVLLQLWFTQTSTPVEQ